MSTQLWCVLVCVGVIMELLVDYRGRNRFLSIGKPLASSAFIGLALHLDAFASTYGQALFAGLVLSWLGDMFLIPKGAKRWFLAGLVSFLLGHVAYVVAFIQYGGDNATLFAAFAVSALPAVVVLRWLWPRLSTQMRRPVIAYVVVISSMISAAIMAFTVRQQWELLVGAALFYLSDLFVARHRFVVEHRINRLVGLPLYYGGQCVLALSLA